MRAAGKWLLWGLVLCGVVLAAMVFLTGCHPTTPPHIVIRHCGTGVLTLEYEGEEEGKFQCQSDGDDVHWRSAYGPAAKRIVLADSKGTVVCSVEGDEFAERYRNAPGKGGRDYALLLSPDGVRWLSREEFYKEVKAIHKLREEAEERKDWLTRELDTRHGLRRSAGHTSEQNFPEQP